MEIPKEEHWRHRLLELMKHLKMRQVKLAEITGIDASYVSRLVSVPEKSGHKNLGVDTMAAIRAGFNLGPGWFDLPLGSELPRLSDVRYPEHIPSKPPIAALPRANWNHAQWPFLQIDPEHFALLSAAERAHLEAGILLTIKGREPPTKQHWPAPTGAAA